MALLLGVKYSTYTRQFFERLKAAKRRGKREAIYSVSGLIARTAKGMLRLRPGKSRAPAPPHAHTKGGLRVIMFAVDGNTSIIGPIRFPRSKRFVEPVPHVHEFGGTVLDLKKFKVYRYPARPYMSRTLEKLKSNNQIPRQFSVSLGRVL